MTKQTNVDSNEIHSALNTLVDRCADRSLKRLYQFGGRLHINSATRDLILSTGAPTDAAMHELDFMPPTGGRWVSFPTFVPTFRDHPKDSEGKPDATLCPIPEQIRAVVKDSIDILALALTTASELGAILGTTRTDETLYFDQSGLVFEVQPVH